MSGFKITLMAAILGSGLVFSETAGVNVSGQIRERSMIQKNTDENSDSYISHQLRSRAAISANPAEKLDLRLEIQDSRTMGTELPAGATAPHTTTIGNSMNLDLHQAYANVALGPVSIKLGRQKLALGSQRFISSLEWHPNARVFDGASSVYKMGEAASLTALALLVNEASPTAAEGSQSLYGLHYARKLLDVLRLEVYGFYEYSDNMADAGFSSLANLGARIHGKAGVFLYEEEFQYQLGEVGSTDKSAFFNATRLGAQFTNQFKASFGFDMMSGSDDGSMENTYLAKYFFAHAYFGWMDYFLANPATGLMDFRVDLDLALGEKLAVKSQNHYFLQAAPIDPNDNAYGWEMDLELHAKILPKANIVLGAGLFIPEEGIQTVGMADDEASFQFYFMPIFNF